MRPRPAPIGEGLRGAILRLFEEYPPPPPGSEARRRWWHTLVGAVGQVVREVDRGVRAHERGARKFPDSARCPPSGPPRRARS